MKRGSNPAGNFKANQTEEENEIATAKRMQYQKENERETKVREFRFAWYNNLDEIPIDAREGATWSKVGSKAFLIGGINKSLIDIILAYDIQAEKFTEISVKYDTNILRFNHSAIVYRKKIYIFGGERYNNINQSRFTLQDIKCFDSENYNWSIVVTCGEVIAHRRSHACCLIGKTMIVHGGIDNIEATFADLWILNLDQFKWIRCHMDQDDIFLSHHTMCGVFNTQIEFVDILNFKDFGDKKKEKNGPMSVYKEGIYIFGGKDQNGKAKDTLYIINTESRKKYSLEKVEPLGKPPKARYGHCMVYLALAAEKQNLVIYGGRNDTLWETRQECTLDDIYV